MALGMLPYFCMTVDFTAQGRYLFIVMPAFAILLPLGIGALFSRDGIRDHAVVLALPALLAAVNISIFAITPPRNY